jgi:hypothetical protein
MGRSTDWGRSRWVALACVIALHVAVIIVLVRLQTSHSVEPLYFPLLILPWNTRPVEPPADRPSAKKSARATPVRRALPETPVPPPRVASAQQAAPIDWTEQAQRAARDFAAKDAKSISTPASSPAAGVTDANSWFPPPAHHKGDQYTNESGERIVWISDKCYQVSGSSLLTVPEVFSKAMIPKTVCPRHSGKPRGDLFKDLPAYKKYHPEQ